MLLTHGLLVLVLDGSRMQILRNRGSEARPDFEILNSRHVDHPPTHELGTDRPGRAFGSANNSRHSYSETDLHERGEDAFALASLNDLAAAHDAEAPIVLIAPPRLLGHLRKLLRPSLEQYIAATFDKDLAKEAPTEIARYLIARRI